MAIGMTVAGMAIVRLLMKLVKRLLVCSTSL